MPVAGKEEVGAVVPGWGGAVPDWNGVVPGRGGVVPGWGGVVPGWELPGLLGVAGEAFGNVDDALL